MKVISTRGRASFKYGELMSINLLVYIHNREENNILAIFAFFFLFKIKFGGI